MEIEGREFKLKDTLADQINVGLYQMKLQKQADELNAKIASGKLVTWFDRIASIIPFKWRMHYSMRKAWYGFLDVAIEKNFVWKYFRIHPKQLRYSVIGAEQAEELKAGFFGLWEAILGGQNKLSKPSSDTKQNNTELNPSQKDLKETI